MVTPADAAARLADADWLHRPETQKLFMLLDGPAGRTRAVGGIVRDTILGVPRPETEIDLATELVPDKVMSRAAAAGIDAYPTGVEHGTVTLRFDGVVAEVTTLREDVATDGRHAVVRFGTDWMRDAQRRDFTMNALYAGMDGELSDPLGGLDDCVAGRVRFIGDASERIAEDRLRVYRFFRFSASHGGERLDPAGLDACRAAASKLGRLSAERVGAEMRRMLGLPRVAMTLQAMSLAGVLGLSGETLRLLTSYELRANPPTLAARMALFVTASDPKTIQKQWRLSNGEIAAAVAILECCRLLRQGAINEAAYRHPAAMAEALDLAAISEHWDDERVAAVREELAYLQVPKFPVSGRDLIKAGMRPGKLVGQELRRLETAWIESGFTLDRKALLGMRRG
jgi:poly(A) polymerase